ncbi:hypothetical protein [Pseudomonas indica]|uniref:hypothetical protein n=1 Tax=Pseudomonas indica TaxID=137658 RepID=UPI003FD14F4B
MLNSLPLNSAPLNSLGAGATAPEYIARGFAFVWRIRLMVNGVDMSAQLTGAGDTDREEGAAGVGGFDLYIPDGPVVPTDWVGRSVTIYYISITGGVTTEQRLLTGVIATVPTWDPTSRVLGCECTDRLQQRIEALTVAEVDTLVGGTWSADIYEPAAGRSRWDYAQERLASRTASLDCSATGELRVTDWFATPGGFVFGPGTTLYGSVGVELAEVDSVTNRVEIETEYRYSRLREFGVTYSWTAPAGSFCAWRLDSHELPDIDMVISATEGAGLVPVSASWGRLPPTDPDPCGTGSPWINTATDVLWAASWTGAVRWVQTVTETYTLTLTTGAGEVEATRIIGRTGQSFEVDSGEADGWPESLQPITVSGTGSTAIRDPKPGYGPPGDRDDETRRLAGLACQLNTARAEIIAAHRRNSVTWSVPASMAMGIDLVHTLEIDDQDVHARGKCRRLQFAWDLGSGEAMATLSIAIMRATGAEVPNDPLIIPPRPGATSEGGSSGSGTVAALPTQLGGKLTSPPYDDELDGFAGNYSIPQDTALETFPRRLTIDSIEIPAEDTDELPLAADVVYRVHIPNDVLEM